MTKVISLFFGIIVLSLFLGCEKKVGKPVATASVITPAGFTCDSIKYTKHIKPIILNNCAYSGCHDSGFSSGDFTTYAGLNTRVTNGKFKARVFDANPGPMPASGKLPQTQLDSIKCWLDRGAPND